MIFWWRLLLLEKLQPIYYNSFTYRVRTQNEIRFYVLKSSALKHLSLKFILDFTSIPVLFRCYKITTNEHRSRNAQAQTHSEFGFFGL